ncbi:hypothetical protein AcV5_003777 [Taiwanofungus camphoratus]|nr:hypothetical protein AcV5_003777 [Antrodia cinnamomea]KAI0915597.1 hypothetical protein AcV5_003777 [Antrodia cinnamomea]
MAQANPQIDTVFDHPFSLRPSTMGLLDMCNEVFAMILGFVTPAEAMQLALTCHRAYELAMPRFLSEVVLGCTDPAIMSGPQQITLFCNYMLSDISARMGHLKVLEIREGAFVSSSDVGGSETWVNDFSCAGILADMLREASNLRRLYIKDLEPLLFRQPTVGDALVKHTRIRYISFHYIGKCTLEMLGRAHCRPYRLDFGMWKDGPRVAGDMLLFDHYAHSLETLNLWQCACLLASLDKHYVSPSVRELGLGGSIPELSRISRAYPSVRTIVFEPECSVAEEEPPTAYWQSLDRVEMGAPLPFFSCNVRRLELRYVLGIALPRLKQDAVAVRTMTLLEQTNPVVLSCVVSMAVGEDTIQQLAAALPKLKFLELVLSPHEVGSCDEVFEFESWMTRYMALFEKVPLVGVSLCRRPGKGCKEVPCRTVRRLARMLVERIPTLKYVGIGLPIKGASSSKYQYSPVWYCVKSRAEGNVPVLELLSSGRGDLLYHELLSLERSTSWM